MGIIDEFSGVEEGDTIIADIDPEFDQERGVATLQADQSVESYAPATRVRDQPTNQALGDLRETDSDSPLEVTRGPMEAGGDPTTVAEINDITVTDRNDLEPIGIGRDKRSGEFTPDNTVPAPESPSDRDPDDGEFTTPDPRPITDIGRQRSDGLFDLF
jgi:hypothetical protein